MRSAVLHNTFVIPAHAGIHLLSADQAQGCWKTLPLRQTMEREIDSRVRENDELGVGVLGSRLVPAKHIGAGVPR